MACYYTLLCSLSCWLSLFLVFKISFASNATTIPFDVGYAPLFGEWNLVQSSDRRSVQLLLDRTTGSGFVSSHLYDHGFISASIKLPSNYTAGVVVAFYTSNEHIFEKTHDELDFEFLGNVYGRPWRVQTNVYGNGSTSRGREERYILPFDPSKEFHQYSILWTNKTIVFYIDDIPIRMVTRNKDMGGDYPSKPMSIYATIWDGSAWATNGGRYKVNYKYAPFISEFRDLILHGCEDDAIRELPMDTCSGKVEDGLLNIVYASMTPDKQSSMRRFREKHMIYSYCYDIFRYPSPLPECEIISSEKSHFLNSGRLKFGHHNRHSRQKRNSMKKRSTMTQQTI